MGREKEKWNKRTRVRGTQIGKEKSNLSVLQDTAKHFWIPATYRYCADLRI